MSELYDVVIAEDEPIQLRSLASIVAGSELPFRVVGSAQNGDEALEMIRRQKPSLVIVDVQMPKKSGLEVIKYIHDHRLPVASMVISGYGEFQYAQEALRCGAGDYLLKPVSRQQMASALSGVLARFRKDAPLEDEFSFQHALSGVFTRLPEHCALYFLALVSVGNYPFASSASDSQQANLTELVSRCARQVLKPSERYWSARASTPNKMYCFFGVPDKARAAAVCSELYRAASEWPQRGDVCGPVSLIASRPVTAETIMAERARLEDNLRHVAVFGRNAFVGFDTCVARHSNQETMNQCAMFADQMTQSLAANDERRFRAALSLELGYWERAACATQTMLGILKFQYLLMVRTATKSGGRDLSSGCIDWEERFDEAFSASKSWEQLSARLFNLFLSIRGEANQASDNDAIAAKIERYLLENYASHITNQTLSQQFGFVPSYVSKLFKSYKGVSPGDYLTQIRIEKAKELIRFNPKLALSDVATAVGFSDPSYFSRLFKRAEGVMPTEFRDGPDILR